MPQSFIVFDLEFTAWPGSMERAWKGPGEHREIIHIGAVEISSALDETAALDLLVRPRINPVLSDYITALTGITNGQLAARGIDLAQALPRFLDFVAGRPFVCFGRDDIVMRENVTLYGLEAQIQVPNAVNITPWLRANGIDTKGLHACDTARAAGVDHTTGDHNALEDARSVAKAIRALIAKGANFPDMTPTT